MLYFVYIYSVSKAEELEANGEVWCVQRACQLVVNTYEDSRAAGRRVGDLINNYPFPVLGEDQCAAIGAIPLCHDDSYLA
jgi:hypothetical protein